MRERSFSSSTPGMNSVEHQISIRTSNDGLIVHLANAGNNARNWSASQVTVLLPREEFPLPWWPFATTIRLAHRRASRGGKMSRDVVIWSFSE